MIRLLTYNIHKGIGGRDRRYQLSRVFDVIEEQRPDVICLQEVTIDLPRTSSHNQALLFSKHFDPMSGFFQQNVHWQHGGYGNLILSRWPMMVEHRISLRYRQKKPRGAQVVVLDTPKGQVQVVNWHLGLSEAERHWQADHLMRHSSLSESVPTLLVGDFNDWRNTLAKKLTPHKFSQSTHPPSRFRSFPAMLSLMSLDKVFHRGHLHIKSVKVIRTALAKQASDHLPVVIEFDLDTF